MPDLDGEDPPLAADAGGAASRTALGPVAIVGRGRVGHSVARALTAAGIAVRGPLGRGASGAGAQIVLLAVPDAEIAAAAALIAPGPMVGHFSGATTLDPLAPHEALGIHPLTAVLGDTRFDGVSAAVAGSSPRALAAAEELARTMGMLPFRIDDRDRAAYHAAASIASNFLVTLESFAEELAAGAGVDRAALAPLVRATVQNWERHGSAALTGPVARGDERTVALQRAAVAERMPARTPLFDVLVDATRELVAGDRTVTP
jgi:predicted short-subunit dehydrogenase-like oxidoreductase (DUF2520 family)